MRFSIAPTLVLAVVYAVVGVLSLYPAIPPGYTAPIFPSAGIALVPLLLWGRGKWPGVWLGSLLVQCAAGWQSSVHGWSLLALLLVPSAATVQALAGVALIRRLVGWPNRLDAPFTIAKLYLLVIPLSCLVCSGISVPVLTLLGVIPPDDAVFNGWNWWLGDTFGGLLVFPLMMALFGQPRSLWQPRRLAIVLPMVAVTAMLAVLSLLVHHWESLRIQAQFNRDASQIEQLVKKRLEIQLNAVLSLQQLMTFQPDSSRRDWLQATTPWLARFSGTQNLGWSPLVQRDSRERFEQRLAQEMRDNHFSILARDSAGKTFVSPSAARYLPITYVEPFASNSKVLGLDILSSPILAAAVRRTEQSGQPEATGAIRLVQENRQQRGIVVYQAVFGRSNSALIEPTRLLGIVSSVFRMDDILESALAHAERRDIDVCLMDKQGSTGSRRLSGPEGCAHEGWFGRHPHLTSSFQFAGRIWSLRLRANDSYLSGMRSWLEWATFVGGLAMTGLFGGFLLILTGYTRRVESKVTERTAELAEANQQLQNQLDATRQAEARVEFLAHHDSLTGLPNRAFWLTRSRHAMAQGLHNGSQFAVLFLDLDEFKTVNDSLGHPVGDLLLVEAARRLSVPLPPEALLARLGGDEFVVLLPLGLEQSLTDIVQNLLQAFARPILVEHHELSCTVSIGAALFPQDGPDPDILLRHADLAMYAAKAAGRNDVRYYQPSMNADALERLTLERDLRHALEDSAGGLQLYYQPQVDAVSGQCIGCEALVRWYHPERGMMMPDAFISLAERSGLIVPLGQWVLAEACRQYKIWEAEGMPLSISVNLSPVQLGRSTLAASVQLLFASHQIPPGAIEFELTESALMDDSDDNLQRFHALIALGSSFALDDFGTGYSSLSRLKRYPISRLKIDRSFVMNLPGNAEDAAVATATLSLARDLGMDVVAEGVETPEQRDYLVSRGCHVMQGYLFARPLTAADMKAFCRATMPA